jgi:hypothetical protein
LKPNSITCKSDITGILPGANHLDLYYEYMPVHVFVSSKFLLESVPNLSLTSVSMLGRYFLVELPELPCTVLLKIQILFTGRHHRSFLFSSSFPLSDLSHTSYPNILRLSTRLSLASESRVTVVSKSSRIIAQQAHAYNPINRDDFFTTETKTEKMNILISSYCLDSLNSNFILHTLLSSSSSCSSLFSHSMDEVISVLFIMVLRCCLLYTTSSKNHSFSFLVLGIRPF